MRRIKLVLGALVVMVATFAAFSSPAMADDWNGCGWYGVWNNCGWNDGFGSGVLQVPVQTFVSGSNTNTAGSVTS